MSEMPSLILKRASASRPSGEWNEDDYDVLAHVLLSAASSRPTPRARRKRRGGPDRTPSHGYAETREAAMAALAMSWRRGVRTFRESAMLIFWTCRPKTSNTSATAPDAIDGIGNARIV
jgi:hypothetical protein